MSFVNSRVFDVPVFDRARAMLGLDNLAPQTNSCGSTISRTANAILGDTWYRLRSRAQSRIGRALISALVK
jgi:hypothetical protein